MASYSVMSLILVLLTALIMAVHPARNLHDDRRYEVNDYIPLFANKTFSPRNPCYAQSYFDLPFCPPGSPVTNRKKSLNEVLEGDCFTNTLYELKFKVDKIGETVCEKQLTKDEVAIFRLAVEKRNEFQMYYNNIGMRGMIGMTDMIGKVQEQAGNTVNLILKYYLVNHLSFYAYYFENQVKEIYVSPNFDSAVDITEDVGMKVNFTYSVFWKELGSDDHVVWNETSVEKYEWPTENQSGKKNSLLFIGLASFIYTCVKLLSWAVKYLPDYITWYIYENEDAATRLSEWNRIHGDACRCPPHLSLLAATLGVGTQMMILICALFVYAYKGLLHICDPEALLLSLVSLYCQSSLFSGYIATLFHGQFTPFGCKECICLAGILYFAPVAITAHAINAIGYLVYGISDIPIKFAAAMTIAKWGVGIISLLVLGGAIGYFSRSNYQGTCPTSIIPRDIPQPSWYTKTPTQMFVGGLLPFMAIFPKMDDIYASLWSLKVCGAFDTMLVSFLAVITMTTIVGIIFTCFQFSKKDYQWRWRSVLRGGSTAIFMFAYGIYFHSRAYTHDSTKLIRFMGYNACIFYAFFLALGAIGYYASSLVCGRLYPVTVPHLD